MTNQSLNLTADLLNGFSSVFMTFVYVIIIVYLIILIMNFLRDKFIGNQSEAKKDDITVLLTILNKLFFVSGFGFIIGNLLQVFFSSASSHNNIGINIKGDWDYLTFGIILIFMGLGLKAAKATILKDRAN